MKYRQAGKQLAAASLFSKLPETLETKHAREATQLQSEVRLWFPTSLFKLLLA